MITSNQFPQHHNRYGKDQIQRVKLYDCIYNGTVLCSNVPYAIANGRKQKLLKEQPKNYQESLFTIKPHL